MELSLKDPPKLVDNDDKSSVIIQEPNGGTVSCESTVVTGVKENDAFVFARIPLCADYSSDSNDSKKSEGTNGGGSLDAGSGTEDSEEDSTDETSSSETEEDVNEILKPIEELTISVPQEEAQEMGVVKNVISNQVIVEPIIGIAALDLDTILFLDHGQRALGKVFDVFGPIAEPLYIILINSKNSEKQKSIVPGTKVYFAPKTAHTSFVQLPELLKMKGSDASWKHNREVPDDEQDYSDDEEEMQARRKETAKATEVKNHTPKPSHYTPPKRFGNRRGNWRNPFAGNLPTRYPFNAPPANPFVFRPEQQYTMPSPPQSFSQYSFTIPPPPITMAPLPTFGYPPPFVRGPSMQPMGLPPVPLLFGRPPPPPSMRMPMSNEEKAQSNRHK